MEKSGFTESAAGLASMALLQKKFIERSTVENFDSSYGERTEQGFKATETGRNWLLENQNQLNLRIAISKDKDEDDDIPF